MGRIIYAPKEQVAAMKTEYVKKGEAEKLYTDVGNVLAKIYNALFTDDKFNAAVHKLLLYVSVVIHILHYVK